MLWHCGWSSGTTGWGAKTSTRRSSGSQREYFNGCRAYVLKLRSSMISFLLRINLLTLSRGTIGAIAPESRACMLSFGTIPTSRSTGTKSLSNSIGVTLRRTGTGHTRSATPIGATTSPTTASDKKPPAQWVRGPHLHHSGRTGRPESIRLLGSRCSLRIEERKARKQPKKHSANAIPLTNLESYISYFYNRVELN